MKRIPRENLEIRRVEGAISTSVVVRLGKDLYWDSGELIKDEAHLYPDRNHAQQTPIDLIKHYTERWESEGYRVHHS